MMGSDRDEFISKIAERANVPEEDAADLVRDFLRELAKTLDRSSWEKVQEFVPLSVEVQSDGEQQSLTIEEFLVELSGEEPVEDELAGGHARAVAGVIREVIPKSRLDELCPYRGRHSPRPLRGASW